jgi:uncharacterized protein (DUF1778 family)
MKTANQVRGNRSKKSLSKQPEKSAEKAKPKLFRLKLPEAELVAIDRARARSGESREQFIIRATNAILPLIEREIRAADGTAAPAAAEGQSREEKKSTGKPGIQLFRLLLPASLLALVEQAAAAEGQSREDFIMRAVWEKIEREGKGTAKQAVAPAAQTKMGFIKRGKKGGVR